MDQTIYEKMYKGRINNTVRTWNAQNGNTSGGNIIARDGTAYKKVDGRLVQVLDEIMMKRLKRLENKLQNDGLVACEGKVSETAVCNSSEMVAEI